MFQIGNAGKKGDWEVRQRGGGGGAGQERGGGVADQLQHHQQGGGWGWDFGVIIVITKASQINH